MDCFHSLSQGRGASGPKTWCLEMASTEPPRGGGLVGTALGGFSEVSASSRSPREAAPLPGVTNQLLVRGSEREEFTGQPDGGDSFPDPTKCHEPREAK